MDDSRREFLKKAGVGSLIGLGVASVVNVVAAKKGEASASTSNNSGTRWGMVVDMSKCPSDCKICTEKCHSIHNVPEFRNPDGSADLKNEVKWLWKDNYNNVFPSKSGQFLSNNLKQREFLVLCNHCKDAPCVRVCPTQSTFSRPDGIVLMDFHRCIGCRFCMAACPYGSRSFNWLDPRTEDNKKLVGGKKINPDFPTRERGVVEKCNFCAERLAKNQKPACVEACTFGALTFGNLNDPNSEIRAVLAANNTMQRKSELGTGPSVFYIV